jgi:SagB-type dehydrogenase family enzyme
MPSKNLDVIIIDDFDMKYICRGNYCCYYFCIFILCYLSTEVVMARSLEYISLPTPVQRGNDSLEQLIQQRRSVREFRQETITTTELGQLLWAAQGITHSQGYRTAPSAGALYPLELYVIARNVDGLSPGIYHYRPDKHRLLLANTGEYLNRLAKAALGQSWVKDAAAVVVFAAVFKRTARKYGERGVRYVHIEVGHAGQNLFLQAEALGLGTVVVGAFDDDEVVEVLNLPSGVEPLILMPVGRK